MHQHTPLSPRIDVGESIEAAAARRARENARQNVREDVREDVGEDAEEDAKDDAWETERDAEIAAKQRGCAYAMTCFDCRHLPPDDRLSDPDSFIRTICRSKRIARLIVHAREGCETCPYLPENYGKPVRGRVGGLDDWEDGPEVERIRRARFEAWEAQHGAR